MLCASVQWIGEQGSIVGVRQFNDSTAPHHSSEIPFEFPLLLDAEQADAFQFATHGAPSFIEHIDGPLDSLVLCEVRIRAGSVVDGQGSDFQGELVVADECRLPRVCGDDGLIRLEDTVVKERRIRVLVGDALAMAMRFTLPVLLDVQYGLQAASACIDRMRLEHLVCSPDDSDCDLELVWLRERLADGCKPEAAMATVGALLDEIKPLAWYWADQGHRGPAGLQCKLDDYQHRLAKLRQRSSVEGSVAGME